jgi:uncharacterized protein with NRDE domain
MCLILISWRTHEPYRLVVAANRDEFHVRPSAAAEYWKAQPNVLAGRDLVAGGTWLGVSTTGHWAAVTNFRNPAEEHARENSRGLLVADYLTRPRSAASYVGEISEKGKEYGGFNLFVGDDSTLWYATNRGGGAEPVEPGVHGLSNHLLDTPWPKVSKGKSELDRICSGSERDLVHDLFGLLADTTPAGDDALPDTGVGLERERDLSPIFIEGEEYGTRSSTVLLVRESGEVKLFERSFASRGQLADVRGFLFHL